MGRPRKRACLQSVALGVCLLSQVYAASLPLFTPNPNSAQALINRTHEYEYDFSNLQPRDFNPVPPFTYDNLRKRQDNGDYVTGYPKYPPQNWLNINDASTVASLANAAIKRMQTWLSQTNFQYQWTPWWQYPVAGLAYVDIDVAQGQPMTKQVISQILNNNDQGVHYMIDAYIDDSLWWGVFAATAYQLYGNQSWLTSAEKIQANASAEWSNVCGGGTLWLMSRPNYKNTITNALFIRLSARLYRLTGNQKYFTDAVNTLNWWLGWAFDPKTGGVYDGMTAPSCTPTGLNAWTYNAGSILPGLTDLYFITGDTRLLDLGRTIAYAGIVAFSQKKNGILRESCENDPQSSPSSPPGCSQDMIAFKGIFTMGLGALYVARSDQNIWNFLNTQMLSNAYNNMDDTWLFGQWWGGPWNETTAGPKTQISTIGLLSAALSVNVQYLTLAQKAGVISKVFSS